MPNLQKLKLGFNAPVVDQHRTAHISIEHLSSLIEISAKIWGAGADAESTVTTTLTNHPSNPSIKIDLVDCIICCEESISMGTTGKEPIAPDQQDATMEVENQDECRTQVEDKGEDENTRDRARTAMDITTGAMASLLPKHRGTKHNLSTN